MGQVLNTGAAHAAPTRRALLGGAGIVAVVAAAPAIAAAAQPASQIETYRVEYRAVFDSLNNTPSAAWNEDCPAVAAKCQRMRELEGLISTTPCANRADAEAKLRFACDVAKDGIALDGDDAADMMNDMARYFLPGGR